MPDLIANSDTIRLSPQEPRPADPPFDDQDADLIVRSCDMVDFRVHRIILSLASPKLKAMITALSSTPSPHSLALPEDAHTIDYILRCCYPIATPKLRSLNDIRAVLIAAIEYDISEVIKIAKLALGGHIQKDILGAFSIATHCKLYDICTVAARRFSEKPLLSLDSSELDRMSACSYHKLVQCHLTDKGRIPPTAKDYWAFDRSDSPDPTKATPNLTPGTQIRMAEAPFNDEMADIILRSNDGVRFCVFKNILSIASPFFRDMFSLPQALDPSADSSIIHMSEDARTIDFLLRFCYPIIRPNMTELQDIRLVLDAAGKYDMSVVTSAAKIALEQAIEHDVLGAFAVAVHCRLRGICVEAARQFLQYPLQSLNSPELNFISVRQYHQLLRYHQDCCKVASAATSSRTWFKKEIFRMDMVDAINPRCYDCQEHEFDKSSWTAPSQTWRYLEGAEEALRLSPHRSAVTMQKTLDNWKPAGIHCKTCNQIYSRDRFSQALADEVDRVVAEVEVPSFF